MRPVEGRCRSSVDFQRSEPTAGSGVWDEERDPGQCEKRGGNPLCEFPVLQAATLDEDAEGNLKGGQGTYPENRNALYGDLDHCERDSHHKSEPEEVPGSFPVEEGILILLLVIVRIGHEAILARWRRNAPCAPEDGQRVRA